MRNRERGAVFRQSLQDFPCPVTLGEKTPSFSLHRFRQGLRFVPSDDEGFALRGDKQRLLYKGRRRSHRFTILGDGSFEYDCILLKEPDSNIVSLRMEGAGDFDFFRQPDFVENPFLKGSYAVYKKQTLVGEGTGKLCHIHRPLIIDARGRRCWGNLSIIGNELRITIPERFLSGAKYPVVVDPTIGTTTVGSQTQWQIEPGEPFDTIYFDISIPVNRFLVSETINGLCTGYFYTNYDDRDAGAYPVLYSDNGNSPLAKRSTQENFANLRVTSSSPKGWRSATFKSSTAISKGSYIWFGAATYSMWYPKFDYGARCYADFWDEYDSIPNSYPLFDVNFYHDVKLSMYFTYSSAQNYVRTLTQGLTLTDKQKKTGNYKRNMKQTAKVNSSLSRFEAFYRKCVMTAYNSTGIKRLPVFFRKAVDNVKATTANRESRSISRKCNDNAGASTLIKRAHTLFKKIIDGVGTADVRKLTGNYKRGLTEAATVNTTLSPFEAFVRKCVTSVTPETGLMRLPVFFRAVTESINLPAVLKNARSISKNLIDTVQAVTLLKRAPLFFRKIIDGYSVTDKQSAHVLFLRKVKENETVTDRKSHWGNFIRELRVTAGNAAGTKHEGEYYRFNSDAVNADGKTHRSLSLFIRIVTKVFIRDYLLQRFLIAREELALKSAVCRELILDSKII